MSNSQWNGTVVSIHIAAAAEQPLQTINEVHAVPGKGLEGDRYFVKTGSFSKKEGADREVTLIEIEALEALQNDYHIDLAPNKTRRNIVTRGVPLNHLVGKDFAVGNVKLHGIRLCEPCDHLERLSVPGVRHGLIHRGGLRAQILTEGIITSGDIVRQS